MLGREISGVRIESLLGEGGMGVVYRAARLSDGAPVAVKFIRAEEAADREFTERFEREARILESLDHENILKLHTWGRLEDDALYIVMEFVDGCSLRDVLRIFDRLEVHYALRIVLAAARALESAWKKGVIHRDVKPDNILIGSGGVVKLVDFGLAKDTTDNQKFTLTGQVVGTPAYMSPEQGMGEKVDHRTDIYSLGVTLYTMLAGRRPFEGSTPVEIVVQQINSKPPPLAEQVEGLPDGLAATVDRMMAKEPGDRFATMTEAAEGLEALLAALDEHPSTIADLVAETTGHLETERAPSERVTRVAPFDPTPATAPPAGGAQVIAGKYEVIEKLGTGGMGTVFRVRHRTLGQDFALKVLNPFLASNEAFRERFMREAKAATAFVHKHAVQIREFGEDGALLYMSMDLCPGRTLEDVLGEEGALAENRVASIAHQMLSALKEAHAAGLIHRDLKPSNVMIEDRGGAAFVRILDFGVAKLAAAPGEDTEGRALTRPGAVMGTVRYMSPEQAMGQDVDPRSDLFSTAVILYEALTGEIPFEGENPQQQLLALVTRDAVPLSKRVTGVSRRLERLVHRNLSKDPGGRCASAEEFLAELETLSGDLKSTVAIRRKGLPAWLQAALAGALLVAALVLAGLWWSSRNSATGPSGPTPEQIAAQIASETAAFEKAVEGQRPLEARDRAYTLSTLARDGGERERWERARLEIETAVRRAEEAFADAARLAEAGEWLKARPLFEACAAGFPGGPRAAACAERAAALAEALAAFEGVVVATEPEGAQVFLLGEPAGVTPCLLAGLEPGDLVLTLDLAGYHPVTRTLAWSGQGKVEVRETLRAGAFGRVRVVSTSNELLVVKFLGGFADTTPVTLEKIEAGEQAVEVANLDGVCYALPVRVRKDQTTLLAVDFPRQLAAEVDAWSNLERGRSAAETKEIHRAFLARFPKGKFAQECRAILAALAAEEEAFALCTEGEPDDQVEACLAYERAFGRASYPSGWHVREAEDHRARVLAALEAGAYDAVAAATTLDERRRACREFLAFFGGSKGSAAVREILFGLEAEEALLSNFRREPVFWKKIAMGRESLDRFPGGFWAAEIAAELEALLGKEREQAAAAVAEPDPARALAAARRYGEECSGGPGAAVVEARARAAEEERRVFLATADSIRTCRDYLARFPKGFYRARVEAQIRTFFWTPEETGGAGAQGKLPGGIVRAEGVGEYRCESDGAVMIFVPRGFFPMGSDDWRGHASDGPAVTAWLGAYFLDKYEVTNAQYRAFLDWGRTAPDPHRFCHPDEPPDTDHAGAFAGDGRFNGSEQPVVGVDWFDAFAYARWAGKRLPTEAQWEKAAGADVARRRKVRWPWGDERPAPELCQFGLEGGEGRTEAVTAFPAGRSPLGAFQMAGNVSEWCLDAYEAGFYLTFARRGRDAAPWAANPFHGGGRGDHTIRGGSFADKERNLTTSRRRPFRGRSERVGFRCALWFDPSARAHGRDGD